jgi:hypothetical protein
MFDPLFPIHWEIVVGVGLGLLSVGAGIVWGKWLTKK